jgi:hypothetical protein
MLVGWVTRLTDPGFWAPERHTGTTHIHRLPGHQAAGAPSASSDQSYGTRPLASIGRRPY